MEIVHVHRPMIELGHRILVKMKDRLSIMLGLIIDVLWNSRTINVDKG